MKILNLKYTLKGDDICKEIVLKLIDNVVEQRSGIERKYVEDDIQETFEMKRNCHEAVEIDNEALRNITIIQTKENKHKIVLRENVYKILGEGNTEEDALATDLKDALDLYMKQGNYLNYMDVNLKPWQKQVLLFFTPWFFN